MLYHASAKRNAFVLVELMIVIAVIGILCAIALPGWFKARQTGRAKACMENLSQIYGAVTRWSFDEQKSTGDPGPLMADLTDRKYLRAEVFCPSGGVAYAIPPVGEDPGCPNIATCPDHVLP